jgi:hypothetical protein
MNGHEGYCEAEATHLASDSELMEINSVQLDILPDISVGCTRPVYSISCFIINTKIAPNAPQKTKKNKIDCNYRKCDINFWPILMYWVKA